MEPGEFMKNKTIYLLIVAVILMFIFSGCSNSENQVLEEEISKEPDSIVKTESLVESKPLVEIDTTKYEYAKMSESFAIENHAVVVMLEYDELTNTFLGTINNNTDKNIYDMVIDIIYSSGLSVTKKIYTEIIPGENKITCPGTYEDPYQWRIEFGFGEGDSLHASGENSNIEIKHVGDTIPDDGILIDGYRYAGKAQTYYLEKFGLKFIAFYTNVYNGGFSLIITNETDEIINGLDIGIKMLGINRMDTLENYSFKPGRSNHWGVDSFGHLFDLWRLSIVVVETGVDETKDDNTDIVVKGDTVKPDEVDISEASEENIENESNWPAEFPKSVPHFSNGHIRDVKFTNYGLKRVVSVFFKEVTQGDFDDYIEKLNKSSFIEIIVSTTDLGKQGVLTEGIYKEGENSLTIGFNEKYSEMKISYAGL